MLFRSAALDQVTNDMLRAGLAGLHDLRDDSLLARARYGVRVGLDVIFDDPRKASLLGAMSAGQGVLQNALRRQIVRVAEAIRADPEAADQGYDKVTAIFVSAGMLQISAAYLSGELDLDREALADRLARLSLRAAGHDC